ncbi:phytase [Sphingopyxis sp. BSN-002]|uniref:phytase n=1 Tax=Sphingopyxis sp. BSN-002 TaxID=2911495 RepID=UPI001EDB1CB0|nr:phytase [Sphingopyxis sp. BSN-002]UKK83137.1 phytase [Sphingopyxis sp. BSN-002]
MKTSLFAIAAALAGVPVGAMAQPAAPVPAVAASAETQATEGSGADGAVVLADPADPSRSLILAGAESGGIDVFDLAGKRVATHKAGNVIGLDLRADAAPGGGPLLVALDGKANAPKFFRVTAGGVPVPLALTGIKPGMTVAATCFSRSHRDGTLYLFLAGDKGEIEQWGLAPDASGGMSGRIARRWSLGSEIKYCAADDRGSVYFSQEAVGVWRFAAEPEAEIVPEIVDIVRLGHITEEAKGVAIASDGRLLVSDAKANRLNIYDPADDYAYLGSVALAAGADRVEDGGSVTVAGPVVIVADDDNSPEEPNFKIASWQAVLAAAGLPERPAVPAPETMPLARPTVETTPVETGGDAADDPAIWINPADPAQSVVIGTQKQSGLYVYDLEGKVLQFLPDGRMNNVDLRNGFRLGGRDVTLVTASNRTTKGISIYALDPATRKLTDVADGLQDTGLKDPYGLCMYRSAKTKKTYVFVNQTDGKMRQWELVATPAGKVRAKLMRDLPFATQVEGCVADDETGMLYTGEEDVGIWREGAEPRGGPARTMLAKVTDNPALKDDMEGIGLFAMDGGKGYLVVSSQGNDSYAVFRREGDNAYVGSFRIGADMAAGIDGVSETDGLDVSSMAAGPNFPHGLMVAQDGRNVSPPEHQNFKLVPWERVAKALGLEVGR